MQSPPPHILAPEIASPRIIRPFLVQRASAPKHQAVLILDLERHDGRDCGKALEHLSHPHLLDLLVVVPAGRLDDLQLEVLLPVIGTSLIASVRDWTLSLGEWGTQGEIEELLAELDRVHQTGQPTGDLVTVGEQIPHSELLSRVKLHPANVRRLLDSQAVRVNLTAAG